LNVGWTSSDNNSLTEKKYFVGAAGKTSHCIEIYK